MISKDRALNIIKEAQEDLDSGKISRREFSLIMMSFGALAGFTLFGSSALAWTGTRMRKASRLTNHLISNALRFRAIVDGSLSRTPATTTNRTTITHSFWLKRGKLGAQTLFIAWGGGNTLSQQFNILADDTLSVRANIEGVSNQYTVTTKQTFRDLSAYYHIIVAIDTTQATAANRIKIYVNGVQVTEFNTTTYPSLNFATAYNWTVNHRYGYVSTFDGYLAEVNFIDGQALAANSFGEIDSTTGSWVPKKYAGTYGTNGYYLPFSNGTNTTTLASDMSGNNNNWTATNISLTAGPTYDWVKDTPTDNYATLSPLWHTHTSTQIAVSNGGLRAVVGATDEDLLSPFKLDGKMYFEVTLTAFSTAGTFAILVGVCQPKVGFRALSNSLAFSRTYVGAGGPGVANDFLASYLNNAISNVGSIAMTTNDVLSFAVDTATGKVWAARNGTWVSGDPALGTAPSKTFTMSNGDLFPFIAGRENSNTMEFNFGQRSFVYTPPTGFKLLCTSNLSAPVIKKPNQYFNLTAYAGTSGAQSIVNSGSSQPDLVWIKNRSAANNHNLFDSTRGPGWMLSSSTASAEINNTANFTSFNSNGFSLASNGGDTNLTGNNYVAWQWKKGVMPGFDIVSYVGNGITGTTIPHALGAVPKMIIVRNRDNVSSPDWAVYHANANAAPASGVLGLNGTYSFFTTGGPNLWWNNTTPTSSVFSIGSSAMTNENGKNHIAYLFAEVDGFSKLGSYVGNASVDGPFIYCGFRPAFIMIKRVDSGAENWHIADTGRSPNNPDTFRLWGNLANAEASVVVLDKVSNGFKIRESSTATNGSGGTYIFMAFAEAPFKYANAK